MKKIFKSVFYNTPAGAITGPIIALIGLSISSYNSQVEVLFLFGLCCFLCGTIIFIISIIPPRKYNKGLRYMTCIPSIFNKNKVWFNFRIIIIRDNKKCPKIDFMYEMKKSIKKLPKGTICYCNTHEEILKVIKNQIPAVEADEIYTSKLKFIKISMHNKHCKTCYERKKECSIYNYDKMQFYAVKFII